MLLGAIGVLGFSLTLPATRHLTYVMDPFFIAFGRVTFAALIAIVLLLIYKAPLPSKETFSKLLVVAMGVAIGFPLFTTLGMVSLPSTHGAVVLAALPLTTAVCAAILAKEKPSIGFWFVSIVGFLCILSFTLLQGGGEGLALGDVSLFAAIVFAAVGYTIGAGLVKEMSGWRVICWALILSLPLTVVPTIYYAPTNTELLTPSIYGAFLYLALVSQLFAFFAWYKGLSLGGIAKVGQVQLLQPFFTLFASYFLLGEHLGVQVLIFSFVIICIVMMSRKMNVTVKPFKKINV